MNLDDLERELHRAGVDPGRYLLPIRSKEAMNWMLRPEGQTWLRPSRSGTWEVAAGGIGPHYDCFGTIAEFATVNDACTAFLRELTLADGQAFAAQRAAWSQACVSRWQQGEARIAQEEPDVAEQRRRWHARWARRQADREPAMTIEELEQALVKAEFHREGLQLQGKDELRWDAGRGPVIGQDQQGRWYHGRWQFDRPGFFLPEYRFLTEAEVCQHFYESYIGPYELSPPLTYEQWQEQRALAADNRDAYRREEEQSRRPTGD